MSTITRAAFSGIGSIALCVALMTNTLTGDANTFLNAPKWKVEYEITFAASSEGSYNSLHGTCNYTTALKRTHSCTVSLDLRSIGASFSVLKGSALGQDPSTMSVADAQKLSMEMMNSMNSSANWMQGGTMTDETMTEEQQAAALQEFMRGGEGSAHLTYDEVVKGDDLHTEMGTPYRLLSHTTYEGTGKVNPGNQMKFEINTSANSYLLMLSPAFDDRDTGTVKVVNQIQTESPGEPAHDSTATHNVNLSSLPQRVVVDDTSGTFGESLYLRGSFDPLKPTITGERTLRAHYSGSYGEIPGTLTVRWTLTPQ